MSSSDEEASSPVLGASSSKDRAPVTPLESESDSDDCGKKKTPKYKRPRVQWNMVHFFVKGADAEMDDDERKLQIEQGARAFMEAGHVYKVPGHKAGPTDCGLWKQSKEWTADGGDTKTCVFKCPLSGRFGCKAEVKITESTGYHSLETRGVHDAESHHPDKDKSKHLKLKQIEAIETGVRIAPNQSARQLRRNLVNLSPSKRVDPKLLRNMKRQVVKVRAELTLEQLDTHKIDDSFGSLVRYADAKWFPTLFANHIDPAADFHLDMYDVFVIGKDINAREDIVYLNFSTLWHLCNILRNIAAGWVFQLNGDATFKVCRRTVALLCLGVNSLGNVNNTICWAIIPEAESAEVMKGTWNAVQDAAIMLMTTFRPCGRQCPTCDMVMDLLGNDNVKEYLTRSTCTSGLLEVDLTLSDRSLGWGSFTREIFGFDPNICRNHVTAIPAAQHSQVNYFKSREVYDTYYDEVVRLSKVGHEVVARKGHEAMVDWLRNDLEDPEGADYYHKTWSLDSGYGRFCVVYGMYGGSTTNGGTEANWRDKREICPKTATLGTFMGALVHNIKCKGDEHNDRLCKAQHPNRFPSIPEITKETWQNVMAFHPKTLTSTLAIRVKTDVQVKISDLFDNITEEMYSMGDSKTPLHLKIGMWHEKFDIKACSFQFTESSVGKLLMPSQRLMYELDPYNSRDVNDVRQEAWVLMAEYKLLIKDKNTDYKKMKLPAILDLYGKFHYLEYKMEDWSVVDWGCDCVACLRDCACHHSTLIGMFFSPKISVPDSIEEAVPSMRKGSMLKRGIAGSKRKKYLAAKSLETKKDFVKSKKLRVVGPLVSTPRDYLFSIQMHMTSTYRTMLTDSPFSSAPLWTNPQCLRYTAPPLPHTHHSTSAPPLPQRRH